MDLGFIPAPTKNSVNDVLNLVCPLLKSSPTINTPCYSASLITPGTRVF